MNKSWGACECLCVRARARVHLKEQRNYNFTAKKFKTHYKIWKHTESNTTYTIHIPESAKINFLKTNKLKSD